MTVPTGIPTRIVLSRLIFALAGMALFFAEDLFSLIAILIATQSLFIRFAPMLPRREYPSFAGIASLVLLCAFRLPLMDWNPIGTIVLWILLTMAAVAWGIHSDLRLFRSCRYYHRNV